MSMYISFVKFFFMIFSVLAFSAAVIASETKQQSVQAINVSLDQAKLVKLPKGTDTIVIGNPGIADISVQKNDILVITGRSAGRTNFVAIDSTGKVISESIVTVGTSYLGTLIVQRGDEQSSYDCSPTCLPTIALGDSEKHFAYVSGQIKEREAMAAPASARANK